MLFIRFRMVVVETKSQIIEMSAHELAVAHATGASLPVDSE